MTKHYEYNLTYDLVEIVNKPIRQKNDVIVLLLNAIRLMISNVQVTNKQLGTFKVNINKMSRIVFCTSYGNGLYRKNFSFTFPFYIKVDEDDIIYISSINSKIVINATLIRILLKLAEEDWFDEKKGNCENLLDVLDKLVEAIKYFNINDSFIEENVWTVAKELFLFEPGYIRYDCDQERADKIMHPLHHLDIFFSSQATFKLGINEVIIREDVLSREDLINVLDITTPCYYIVGGNHKS